MNTITEREICKWIEDQIEGAPLFVNYKKKGGEVAVIIKIEEGEFDHPWVHVVHRVEIQNDLIIDAVSARFGIKLEIREVTASSLEFSIKE